MGTKNPSVTVGIPFYQETALAELSSAVKSILMQTRPPDCIHLIQDGPVTAEVEKLVKDISALQPSVQHFQLEQGGLPKALNHSLQHTDTTFYARMDSDDIAHPERIAKQVAFLDSHPDVQILGGWAIEFKDEQNYKEGFLKKMPADFQDIKQLFHYRNPLIHSTVMFRMSVFPLLGYYDEAYITNQDLELWARALKQEICIANIPEVLLYFRSGEMVKKRTRLPTLIRQIRASYQYNTCSPKLNVLKILAVIFRLLPLRLQKLGYKFLR